VNRFNGLSNNGDIKEWKIRETLKYSNVLSSQYKKQAVCGNEGIQDVHRGLFSNRIP